MAKVIKTAINIQHEGMEVTDKQIIDSIKKRWTESGKLIKDLNKIDIYVKPSEGMVYYVIEDVTYSMAIADITAQ